MTYKINRPQQDTPPVVKISSRTSKPTCPICRLTGRFFGQGGEAWDDKHTWVWDEDVLIAVLRN